MAKGWVQCHWCNKDFLKDKRHINENIKIKNNFFCSGICLSAARYRQITLVCENPYCQNRFKRAPWAFSVHNFCSHSCAAIFTNFKRFGRSLLYSPQKKMSKKEIFKRRLAGSALGGKNRWLTYKSIYTEDFIIKTIQRFVRINHRIPLKRELNKLYRVTRKLFGTWNKAIEAAGFVPNPVLFANHQVASDGHVCDSMAERIIDDYLTAKNIPHERNSPYPRKEFTADFKVGNVLIEYFGLAGQHNRYDKLSRIKKRMVKKHKIRLIEIYPKDLIKGNFLDNLQL